MDAIEFYDKISGSYDERSAIPICIAENRVLIEYLMSLGPETVLDAGCGTGLLLDYWPEMRDSRRYVGYDAAEGMVEKAKVKYPGMKTAFRQKSFSQPHGIWYKGFDLVCCLFSGINCLSKAEIPQVVRKWADSVKEGGTLVIVAHGDIPPEERSDSSISLWGSEPAVKSGYEVSMVSEQEWDLILDEECPYGWRWNIYPFSQRVPQRTVQLHGLEPEEWTNVFEHMIRKDLQDAIRGNPLEKSCSFYLIVAGEQDA